MQDDPDADPVEHLRRALYRPGSTGDDVDRYVRARPAAADEPVADEEDVGPRPPRFRRFTAAVAVVTVVALALVGLAGSRLFGVDGRSGRPPAEPVTAAPRVPAGETLAPDGTFVPTPTPVPVSLAGEPGQPYGATYTGHLYRGRGDSRFLLDLTHAPIDGGQVIVAMTAAGTGLASWRLELLGPRVFPTVQSLAFSRSRPRPTPATPETVRYSGSPPQRMDVRADAGVRWTAFVVFVPPPH